MATSEEELNIRKLINQELDKEKQKQAENLDLSSSLVDSIKEVLGINTRRATTDSNLLKVNKQINTQILNQKIGLTSISELNKAISKNQDILNKGKLTEQSLTSSITDKGKERVLISKKLSDSINRKQSLLDKELSKASQGLKIDENKVNFLQDNISLKEKELESSIKSMRSFEKQLFFTKLNTEELEKQNAEREKELVLAKKVEESLGVAGKLNRLIGTIPGLGESSKKALESVTEEIEETAKATGKVPTKAKAAAMQFKALGKNLVKDLLDPTTLALGAITAIGKSLMSVDKASGEFAKNNGISYQNSLAIRGEMNEIARSSNDVVVSSKALMETQGTLNTFFGQSTKFTGKLAEDMTSIAKRTGLSGEAQGLFALESMKTGKGVKDILKTQTLTVMEMNKEKGLQMSVKQVQEAIAKTSSAVYLTFKGNSSELTKQVMSVKALGSNMAQVEGIASSLLDFESSIQAELEAELLLGKDINLEKARQAALEGDMGKVAEEVLENKAIMNAFETKNVIAQEAAAKALGMNRDQLAGMIKEQEKLEAVRGAGFDSMSDAQKAYNKMRADGLSKEEAAAKMKDKDLAAQLESVSAAEKFEATMARVQELFIALAEPILTIIQPIADILVPALNFVSDILTGIKDIISSIFDPTKSLSETFQEMGPVVSFIAAGLTAAGLAITAQMVPGLIRAAAAALTALPALISGAIAAVTSASAATLGIGAIAIAAGIAAVIASMSSATSQAQSQMNDGMIGPDGGMIVSGPKGSIQLNKQDSIIAGTDLLGGGNNTTTNTTTTTTSEVDNSEMITLLKNQNTILQKIAAKSSTIEMNGNQVGQEINTSERAIQ